MSLWSKLGWRHWWLKHLDPLKTQSVLRNWCRTMRSFKNDQALIQFWINCWLQSRQGRTHGWRLAVDGKRLSSCSHREQGPWELFCVTYKSSELSIIPLPDTKNTVDGWRISDELLFTQRTGALKGAVLCDISKQLALCHRTAGDGVWS